MEILIKSKFDIIKNSKYSQAELNHRLLPDMHAVTDIRAKLYQLSYESIIHGNPGLGFCLDWESNPGSTAYKAGALTPKPSRHCRILLVGVEPTVFRSRPRELTHSRRRTRYPLRHRSFLSICSGTSLSSSIETLQFH